jgi:hypothetical protein
MNKAVIIAFFCFRFIYSSFYNFLNYGIMKTGVLIVGLLLFYFSPQAQKMNNNDNLNKRISEIEDRIALKNLVDTFSILADTKEVEKQTLLFTDDAIVESVSNGQPATPLKGRKQIGDTFSGFLNLFETVYHTNGQQTLTLNGDRATGVSYCLVVLIGIENGKKIKTTMGVHYNDKYIKQGDRWYISKRKSTFAWTDRQPLGQ